MNTPNNYRYNPILDGDSYKISHHLQYPEGASALFSYVESRGGQYDSVLMFGLQYIILRYLSVQITDDMVDEAREIFDLHGMGHSFNEDGWRYIVRHYDGHIPVTIKAVPEGTLVPVKNVLATIYCDDPNAFWVVTWIETMLLRMWAPTTTATKSFMNKRAIKKASEISNDYSTDTAFEEYYRTKQMSDNILKLFDFGARGASSLETAAMCGAGHLVNFAGSDNLPAIHMLRHFYNEPCAAISIDASEHSTMTALGPQGETIQFERMINMFGDRPIFACVSDGFDIFNAIEHIWGGTLKQRVIEMNALLVVRPDSGDPIEIPLKCIEMLDRIFGSTVNPKGFKVLNHVRVIQGDGIDYGDVVKLCERMIAMGYSIENLNFGMGGGLLQNQTRDTCKFACKNSWMMIDGKEQLVYKDPITDRGKVSKKGRMTLVDQDGQFTTITELTDEQFHDPSTLPGKEVLREVYHEGAILNMDTLEVIRKRAEQFL